MLDDQVKQLLQKVHLHWWSLLKTELEIACETIWRLAKKTAFKTDYKTSHKTSSKPAHIAAWKQPKKLPMKPDTNCPHNSLRNCQQNCPWNKPQSAHIIAWETQETAYETSHRLPT